ncbi:hypothetical protein QBC38DRAFT_219214 [Podospora fimiseda]|uniref:Uncharacterized protein n=1 Tax=Podospora fimiseda TaxID=252190 RepID=A0AAN7GY11_9PEZI|nr:hypothetical protein QBC38DRAFT_219214 [Podospora fimiseda]
MSSQGQPQLPNILDNKAMDPDDSYLISRLCSQCLRFLQLALRLLRRVDNSQDEKGRQNFQDPAILNQLYRSYDSLLLWDDAYQITASAAPLDWLLEGNPDAKEATIRILHDLAHILITRLFPALSHLRSTISTPGLDEIEVRLRESIAQASQSLSAGFSFDIVADASTPTAELIQSQNSTEETAEDISAIVGLLMDLEPLYNTTSLYSASQAPTSPSLPTLVPSNRSPAKTSEGHKPAEIVKPSDTASSGHPFLSHSHNTQALPNVSTSAAPRRNPSTFRPPGEVPVITRPSTEMRLRKDPVHLANGCFTVLVNNQSLIATVYKVNEYSYLRHATAEKMRLKIHPVPASRQAPIFTPLGVRTPSHWTSLTYTIPTLDIDNLSLHIQLLDEPKWAEIHPQADLIFGTKWLEKLEQAEHSNKPDQAAKPDELPVVLLGRNKDGEIRIPCNAKVSSTSSHSFITHELVKELGSMFNQSPRFESIGYSYAARIKLQSQGTELHTGHVLVDNQVCSREGAKLVFSKESAELIKAVDEKYKGRLVSIEMGLPRLRTRRLGGFDYNMFSIPSDWPSTNIFSDLTKSPNPATFTPYSDPFSRSPYVSHSSITDITPSLQSTTNPRHSHSISSDWSSTKETSTTPYTDSSSISSP